MAADAHTAADFYATVRGAVTGRLLSERLVLLWPDLTGQRLLGIGYTAPFLRLWRDQAYCCIGLVPAQMGAVRWPPSAPNLFCTAEEDALPLPDLTFDRVLMVHGLEAAENARRMLREAWRVLKDDGRLLIVVPNRAGMWAYLESTPFGHGQPYSAGQIGRVLSESFFRVERREAALYWPPSPRRIVLRAAPLMERAGRRITPGLAGVTIVEAVKDVYAPLPVRYKPRRRLVLAEAA